MPPAMESPAMESPAMESPAMESPAADSPAMESPTAALPAAATPAPRAQDWFVGAWAGVDNRYDGEMPLSDFGAALEWYLGEVVFLEIQKDGDGYAAWLGRDRFAVTAHDMDGFTLVCTQAYAGKARRQSDISFEVGDSVIFTYEAEAQSSVPGMRVPEREILRGQLRPSAAWREPLSFLLAYLPPAELPPAGLPLAELPLAELYSENGAGGQYPHWVAGYAPGEANENSLFCLGVNHANRRFFGMLEYHGEERFLATLEDGYNASLLVAPRDPGSSDIAFRHPLHGAPDAWWPQFKKYDLKNQQITDTTVSHMAYFEEEYIPLMEAAAAKAKASPAQVRPPAGIFAQAGALAQEGLAQFARALVAGEIPAELVPYALDYVLSQQRYRPEVRFAGYTPGDTLQELQKTKNLRLLGSEGAGGNWESVYMDERYAWYADDADSLLLAVYPDGSTIHSLWTTAPLYGAFAGTDIHDAYSAEARALRVRGGLLSFGDQEKDRQTGSISLIQLEAINDMVWDELRCDIDGDGEQERLTIGGRCSGAYVEMGTHGAPETGPAPYDYGTKTRLCVYKGDALVEEAELPLYIYYLLPQFAKEQPTKPGRFVVACQTGGTGTFASYYEVRRRGDGTYAVAYMKTE